MSTAENRPRSARKPSLFRRLENFLQRKRIFPQTLPLEHLPKAGFIFGLALAYVANNHYHSRLVRQVQLLRKQTTELRADFTTEKAAYMKIIRQSRVAEKLANRGIVESTVPPWTICP